ncbi:MAG TPA: prepilin-type N-terminal cleavage/methylation domain-containing protein [Candidatus Ozemobacteraceae bacterium]|nr:prepilin-type N-terminal cleavage/methylation domain-containing protein [Candidatus Ozemobacteraceae bacterium]
MTRVGFTLIELIVVVAVIAVLSVTAFSYYQDSLETSRQNVVRQNCKLVRDALGRYFQTNLEYPVDLKSLTPAYLLQSADDLLVVPLGSASIEVEIPTTAVTTPGSVNPLQHTGSFEWVTATVNAAKANGPRQIRAVRVRAGNGFLIE